MKAPKTRNWILLLLSSVVFIACVLSVILQKDAAISLCSAPAILFALCSSVYAVIAFANRKQGNLFLLGSNKLFLAFLRSFRDGRPDTDSEEYKKEFALSAFLFCASIPLYLPLAFFAKSFSVALSSSLSLTALRLLCIFLSVLIPRLMKHLQSQKQARLKEETDRKEQERRESMGEWK